MTPEGVIQRARRIFWAACWLTAFNVALSGFNLWHLLSR